MELSAVGILVTYQCNIRCRHCYINCGPDRKGAIDLALAESLLRQAKEAGLTGSNIHLGGGEAFLHFDRVVDILRIAERLGMTPISWVETNCFWCTSDKIARDRLRTLHEAGVSKIWLSADPYHQEYVPFENVARAKRIAVEIFGEDRITISRRQYFDSPDAWPDHGAFVNAHPPMLMGRAYEHLRNYLPRKPLDEIARERCEKEVSPEKMREVHINPDGSIMPSNCSGIILGDAGATTLSKLCGTDDWRKGDIPRVLADRGPVGLLDLAPGFEPKETYAQRCELCWEVRSFLASDYPETLAPPECYSLR